jgi:site-specific DNA recombinase
MPEVHQRRAVAHYRVSTFSQSQTGTEAEEFGASIASQQEACRRYTAEHGLEVVAEYVELGGSGTAIGRGPRFRELLDRAYHRQDVNAVVVYARSRAFGNAYETMATREEFCKLGVDLLSTQESAEAGLEGELVTLILDGVNEYQSRKLAADVSFEMAAKGRPAVLLRAGRSSATSTSANSSMDGTPRSSMSIP